MSDPQTAAMTNVTHIKKNAGWSVFERIAAVVPNNDTIEHKTFSEVCDCRPFWDGSILVHNAIDGRKAYEG